MPARDCVAFAARKQLGPRARPGRVQKTIVGDVRLPAGRYERFVDQLQEPVGARGAVLIVIACDREGCSEVERSSEDRQPSQDGALGLRQELVAPIEGGIEVLV